VLAGAFHDDPNRHDHRDLPVLAAVPGIKGNRHIDAKQRPMTDLFLTMMDGLGIEQEKLGDSTGRLNLA